MDRPVSGFRPKVCWLWGRKVGRGPHEGLGPLATILLQYSLVLPILTTPRNMASVLKRSSLKLGMIPADGIGKEVLPVRSSSSRPRFIQVDRSTDRPTGCSASPGGSWLCYPEGHLRASPCWLGRVQRTRQSTSRGDHQVSLFAWSGEKQLTLKGAQGRM